MPEYRICVTGLLDPCWSEWLEGLSVVHLESGETLLSGLLVDQSAFYGLMNKLRDMNVQILRVELEGGKGQTR